MRPSGQALVAAYKGIICDLDGVVYQGERAIAGAPEALSRLHARGLGIVYATNNASRLPESVVDQLTALGAPASVEMVVTSAQAGAVRVRRRCGPGAKIVALGGSGLSAALVAEGLQPVAPGDRTGVAVLQGYGPALTVEDFALAARHLHDGLPWVATNTDTSLPQSWGLAPGNGAYVDLLAAVTGRSPDVVGKPEAPLYLMAAARLGDGPALAVGDRLDTDIDGAAAAGLDAAWVLTGVHVPSDLVARAGTGKPRFVIGALDELERPYAAVRATPEGWVCADHRARLAEGAPGAGPRLEIDGPQPHGIEATRAALAALLAAKDASSLPLADLVTQARCLDDSVTAAR